MKQVKRCLALVLALLLALGAMGAMAASTSVKINSTNFPDSAFRKYVKAELDTNKDKKLSAKEIKAATSIDVSNKGIADLTGIEHFTALTSLYCDNNKLKKLDVRKNTKLAELSCDNNKLTSLKLGTKKKLIMLSCINNKLTSLDLGGCTELKKTVKNELWSATKKYALYGWANNMSAFDIKTKLMNGKKVLRKYAKPTKVAFTKKSVTLKKGDGSLLPGGQRVVMTPANVVYPFTLSSDDTKVFACDAWDEWEALKKGTAKVTVKCGGKTGTLKITVK